MNTAIKLSLTLAIIFGAAVVVADNRALDCRSDYLGELRGLSRMLTGQMIDEVMGAAIGEAMNQRGIPAMVQPLARPFFESEVMCHLSEGGRK